MDLKKEKRCHKDGHNDGLKGAIYCQEILHFVLVEEFLGQNENVLFRMVATKV